MRWCAVWGAFFIMAGQARADCIEALGSKREIQLPPNWTAERHPVYAEADAFKNVTLGDGSAMFVMPPRAGACSQLVMGHEDNQDFNEGPRTAMFSGRWSKFWVETGEDMVSGTSFVACKDTSRGAVTALVIVDPSTDDPVDATNPSLFAMTEAVAEMLEYDVECAWEPKTAPEGPVKYVDPFHGTGTVMAGFAAVSGSGTDLEQVAFTRLSVVGRMEPLSYKLGAELGPGFAGGWLFSLYMAGGFTFGKDLRFDIQGILGTRGVSGDRVPTALVFGGVVSVTARLTAQLRLAVDLNATWQASAIKDPSDPTMMTETLDSPAFEPDVTVLIARKWLGAGIDVRELGDGISVGVVAGILAEI